MLGIKKCAIGISPPCRNRQWLGRVKEAAIILVILVLLNPASAQYDQPSSDEPETVSTSPKKLEDTVVTDMLRIVDNKFDTLTTRITSLERAVSNLQFFSIRQFRGIGGALQELTKGMGSLSDQVGTLEVDGRGLKITSRLLHREVTELKRISSALSSELVSSVTELNANVEKQSSFTRTHVQDALLKLRQDSAEELQKTLNSTVFSRDRPDVNTGPANCTLDMAPMREHFDHRLTQLKRDVYTGVSNLLKAQKSKTIAKCDEILSRHQTETLRQLHNMNARTSFVRSDTSSDTNNSSQATFPTRRREKYDVKKATQSTTAGVIPRRLVDIVNVQPSRPDAESEQAQPISGINDTITSPDLALHNENDMMVMEALTNMTTSVQQAVSYFKNTAHMLEVILSNTDMLVDGKVSKEQSDSAGPLPLQGREQFGFLRQPFSDGPSWVGRSRNVERPPDGSSVSRQDNMPNNCGIPMDVIGKLTGIAKNGSQLLELLTNLAEMSSVSLLRATENLQAQVSNIGGIQGTLDAALIALSEADSGSSTKKDIILKVSNTTDRILELVEAAGSNSGWLPHIYNSVKHQDAVGNRTLHFVTQNHGLLRHLMHSSKQVQAKAAESNSSENRASGESTDAVSCDKPRQGTSAEFTLDEDSLQIIYNTSLQLHRIMPALTKLLAEPDPLFTLVDGGRIDRGRIEIYHRGRWGAVCHRDISHEDADVICRHLGFQGGISAGAGHFGVGAGVSWHLNTSCLETPQPQCASVSHDTTSALCSHDQDAGVICDHMLKIVRSDPSSSTIKGRLEIHHRGLWLPICGEGWTSYSARVACRQMGHIDGRESELEELLPESNSTWLSHVDCRGTESRLDLCPSNGWTSSCPSFKPAGILCV
ncbi:hypothetical protein EGW08_015860 [Elysia chlorotica]|uniref:SRCR domain-containing protein n=1 Tax=Elysia chlorotica TaxID=188477 RepID=A0A3S0ZDF1_ELYCH|nr:hypothetical protein EGW08_015860 [Elysia chlorotica]